MDEKFTYQDIIEAFKMDNAVYLGKAIKDKKGKEIMSQVIADCIRKADKNNK